MPGRTERMGETNAGRLDDGDGGPHTELHRHPYVSSCCQVHPSAFPDSEDPTRPTSSHYGLGIRHCLRPSLQGMLMWCAATEKNICITA
ncbi:hypothetical protein Pcinc_016992 [Petrolisthes cinctipes]|uniref:Uncharacterized protein n=1 Tax=Petrolisthes cinctipes TaxID=88211 RepID=A0AAE1KP09_PETCI|nr:hypothetical protein Pcinc_016992 [Petrolisthes cinctipes]